MQPRWGCGSVRPSLPGIRSAHPFALGCISVGDSPKDRFHRSACPKERAPSVRLAFPRRERFHRSAWPSQGENDSIGPPHLQRRCIPKRRVEAEGRNPGTSHGKMNQPQRGCIRQRDCRRTFSSPALRQVSMIKVTLRNRLFSSAMIMTGVSGLSSATVRTSSTRSSSAINLPLR
jgi:hypothetical protein